MGLMRSTPRPTTVLAVREAEAARDVDALIDLLAMGDRMGRVAAASALGDLGATEAVDSLLRFTGAHDWLFRGAVVSALGKVGDAQINDALAEIGFTDDSLHVRYHAVEALRALGDARWRQILISLATTAPTRSWLDRQVRKTALEQLVTYEMCEAVAELHQAVHRGSLAHRLRIWAAIRRLSR